MDFNTAKSILQAHANSLLKNLHTDWAFTAHVDNDLLWTTYLASFPSDEMQSHNCHACHSFIKHYGKLVLINADLDRTTIWNVEVEEPYKTVFSAMHQLVNSSPIENLFITKTRDLGVSSNLAIDANGVYHAWQHLSCNLSSDYPLSRAVGEDLNEGQQRKAVLQRALDTISIEATDTVLELIASNQLYRGSESRGLVNAFRKHQAIYNDLPEEKQELYCWFVAADVQQAVICKIRNSAIGTLLIDLGNPELTIEQAVNRFEGKMDNYQRPQAIVTASTAAKLAESLRNDGYEPSLARRYATPLDIPINDTLFVYNKQFAQVSLLDTLMENVSLDPRRYQKAPELSFTEFLTNTLSSAQKVEVLLENRLANNSMTLFTAENPDAPNLLKWDNTSTWCYHGNRADSIRERVQKAGGSTEGKLRVSLSWSNYDDLDLHVNTTNPTHHIYFSVKGRRMSQGGLLDVDANVASYTNTPVENVIFDYNSTVVNREYSVEVNNYTRRDRGGSNGFTVEVEHEGQIYTYHSNNSPTQNQTIPVVTFRINSAGKIHFLKQMAEPSTDLKNIQVAGLNSNQFHNVELISYSPNYWGSNKVGNQHLFLFLAGAQPEGDMRPLFNEYLKGEIVQKHRQALEVLGGKIKPSGKPELTGLGFALTNPNYFICRVTKESNQQVYKVVTHPN